MRALLLEARVDPAIIAAIASRNKLVVQLSSPDFAAMGWAHPEPSAAMWNSAVVETAILELDGGGYRPEIRAALAQFLRAWQIPSAGVPLRARAG